MMEEMETETDQAVRTTSKQEPGNHPEAVSFIDGR